MLTSSPIENSRINQIFREAQEREENEKYYEEAAEKFSPMLSGITAAFRGLSNAIFYFTAHLSNQRLINVLNTIPWLGMIIATLSFLFTSMVTITISKEGIGTKLYTIAGSLVSAGLSATLLILTYLAPMITLFSNSVEMTYQCGGLLANVASFFFGSWSKDKTSLQNLKEIFYDQLASDAELLAVVRKHRRDAVKQKPKRVLGSTDIATFARHISNKFNDNEKLNANEITQLDDLIAMKLDEDTKRDWQLIDKIHTCLFTLFTLISSALIFTDVATAGAQMLIASAIYGIFNKVIHEPLFWRFIDKFKKHDEHRASFDEIVKTHTEHRPQENIRNALQLFLSPVRMPGMAPQVGPSSGEQTSQSIPRLFFRKPRSILFFTYKPEVAPTPTLAPRPRVI